MHVRHLLPLAEECVEQMHAKRRTKWLKKERRRQGRLRRQGIIEWLDARRQRRRSGSDSRTEGDTHPPGDSAGQRDSEQGDQGPTQFSNVKTLLGTIGQHVKSSFGRHDGMPQKGRALRPASQGLPPAL